MGVLGRVMHECMLLCESVLVSKCVLVCKGAYMSGCMLCECILVCLGELVNQGEQMFKAA